MSERRCTKCGSVFSDGSKFCRNDGSPLIEVRAGQSATPAVSSPTPTAGKSSTIVGRAIKKPSPEAADPAASLVNEILDGRYRILRKVGEGGMAFVYEAKELSSGRSVAVKVISPKLAKDETTVERLRREAGLAMRLNHPYVCGIMRLGQTEDGLIYVVMPFMDGELLSDYEFRTGQMSLELAVPLLIQICAGLSHAHELQIVHRDLKPENIFVIKDGSGEKAVVMDFGLAKENRVDSGLSKLTGTGIILGTPEFMSPEQIRGQKLDARSDIYAVGIMAFEMFTAKLPFEGETAQALMIARLRGNPIPLKQYRADLPDQLGRILERSMASDPDARYQSVVEFAEALLETVPAPMAQRLRALLT